MNLNKQSFNSLNSSSKKILPINKITNKNNKNDVINEKKNYSSEESFSKQLKKKNNLNNFDFFNDLYESNFSYENKY